MINRDQAFVVTPSVSVGVPSYDYDCVGEAVVERAAIILALADEIEARCPRGQPIAIRTDLNRNVTLSIPVLPSWLAKDLDKRFERAFGRALIVRH